MAKLKQNSRIFILEIAALTVLSIIILAGLSFAAFTYYFSDKILPNVYVININMGGKTRQEAKEILGSSLRLPETLNLEGKNKTFEVDLSDIELAYNIDVTVDHAYERYRYGSTLQNIYDQITSFFQKSHRFADVNVNENAFREYLDVIADSSTQPPVYPEAVLQNGVVTITSSKTGETIDKANLRDTILTHVARGDFSSIVLTYQITDPTLSADEERTFRQKAEKLAGKSITLSYEFTTYTLKDQKLLSIVNPKDTIFEPKAKEIITKEITPLFNRPAQNAAFKLENGKVQEFKPAKDGIAVNEEQLYQDLKLKIFELESTDTKELAATVPVQTASPSVTTQEVNQLGINELIGRGTSKFKGSIASRVFNVGHASSQLNGVLVPPNTVFSFVNAVGDVSKLTGYKEAYIIQNGRTILGDGGGLCQVSTTLFRAVMNAGLPVLERRAHAYRVGYYEQDSSPGLDATVYVPTTDFKFKNDTPNTILIQTIFDAKAMTLAFELYGTKDGRVATVTKPVILNQIAPAEDLYIDDPTLPIGKVNQVEHKAWGAKVSFDYTVVRDGQELFKKTFVSNYQPWKAVYMRGTGPV